MANDLLALGDRWACLIKWPLTPSLSSAGGLSVFSGVDVLDRVCACICAQIQSGLGKLILKEEMEKEQIRDRHSRSLSAQRYDPKQSNCDGGKEGRRSALPLRLREVDAETLFHRLNYKFSICVFSKFSFVSVLIVSINRLRSRFSDPTSPTKTNSLPGYRSNGLHRVSHTLLTNLKLGV